MVSFSHGSVAGLGRLIFIGATESKISEHVELNRSNRSSMLRSPQFALVQSTESLKAAKNQAAVEGFIVRTHRAKGRV